MPWGSLSSAHQVAITMLLKGGPQFRAQVAGSAASLRMLGRSVSATGMVMRTASKRTWMMNQALFTFHRYAFLATSVLAGLGFGLAKLGISYLAAKDSAMAALGPKSGVFKTTQAFNEEFRKLFKLAKFSPFVIGDLVTAFRVMEPAMHANGISVGKVNETMTALTNIMSESGRTTPANFARISYAIQHMLNQGRLTGRLNQQLANNGINIGLILRHMGVARDQLSNISRLNIDPKNVLNAIIAFSKTGPFRNAAFRISMQSFPGMLAVAKDSLSQFMGVMLGPTYNKFKSRMSNLLKPTSTLGNIGAAKNPHDAVIAISRAITGGQGLGQGFLLLTSILTNLVSLFLHAVIPAFVIALHTLALFLPILWPLNQALRFLTRHAWLVKYALVPLATWFVITKSAALGLAFAQFILNLSTFGVLRGFTLWKAAVVTMYAWELILTTGTWLLAAAFGALAGAEIAASIAMLPLWVIIGGTIVILGTLAAAIYLVIKYWRTLRREIGGSSFTKHIVGGAGGGGRFTGGGILGNWLSNTTGAPGWLTGAHKTHFATGGVTGFNGNFMVGERGPEIVNLPQGSRITPNDAIKPIGSFSQLGGDGKPIVVQVVLDRKVVAEANARYQSDKAARR